MHDTASSLLVPSPCCSPTPLPQTPEVYGIEIPESIYYWGNNQMCLEMLQTTYTPEVFVGPTGQSILDVTRSTCDLPAAAMGEGAYYFTCQACTGPEVSTECHNIVAELMCAPGLNDVRAAYFSDYFSNLFSPLVPNTQSCIEPLADNGGDSSMQLPVRKPSIAAVAAALEASSYCPGPNDTPLRAMCKYNDPLVPSVLMGYLGPSFMCSNLDALTHLPYFVSKYGITAADSSIDLAQNEGVCVET